MWQRPFYHAGMSELQDRFDGRRVAEAIERHRKHYEFWDDEKELIERYLPLVRNVVDRIKLNLPPHVDALPLPVA